jgi:hypothetical protein
MSGRRGLAASTDGLSRRSMGRVIWSWDFNSSIAGAINTIEAIISEIPVSVSLFVVF